MAVIYKAFCRVACPMDPSFAHCDVAEARIHCCLLLQFIHFGGWTAFCCVKTPEGGDPQDLSGIAGQLLQLVWKTVRQYLRKLAIQQSRSQVYSQEKLAHTHSRTPDELVTFPPATAKTWKRPKCSPTREWMNIFIWR